MLHEDTFSKRLVLFGYLKSYTIDAHDKCCNRKTKAVSGFQFSFFFLHFFLVSLKPILNLDADNGSQ